MKPLRTQEVLDEEYSKDPLIEAKKRRKAEDDRLIAIGIDKLVKEGAEILIPEKNTKRKCPKDHDMLFWKRAPYFLTAKDLLTGRPFFAMWRYIFI